MGNLDDIFGEAQRSYKKLPNELAGNVKKAGRDLEKNVKHAITDFTTRNLSARAVVGKVARHFGSDLSIEHAIHWYMRGDAERRLVGLIKSKINFKKIFSFGSTQSSESEGAKRAPMNGLSDDYATLNNFWCNVLSSGSGAGSNASMFMLQYRYLFQITMSFNTRLTPVGIDRSNVGGDNSTIPRQGNVASTLFNRIKYNFIGDALKIALLARAAVLPNITSPEMETLSNQFGYISLPSDRVMPDSNELTLSFLACEYPINEIFFLEWIKETCSDIYLYREQPFQKADINIEFIDQKHNKIIYSYTFVDAYPKTIITTDAEHDASSLDFARDVTFVFDYMRINPNFESPPKPITKFESEPEPNYTDLTAQWASGNLQR